MALRLILRDRTAEVRLFGRNLACRVALCVPFLLVTGCWTDIPYNPSASAPGAEEPSASAQPSVDEAETVAPEGLFASDTPSETETTVEETPKAESSAESDAYGAELFGAELASVDPPIDESPEPSPEAEVPTADLIASIAPEGDAVGDEIEDETGDSAAQVAAADNSSPPADSQNTESPNTNEDDFLDSIFGPGPMAGSEPAATAEPEAKTPEAIKTEEPGIEKPKGNKPDPLFPWAADAAASQKPLLTEPVPQSDPSLPKMPVVDELPIADPALTATPSDPVLPWENPGGSTKPSAEPITEIAPEPTKPATTPTVDNWKPAEPKPLDSRQIVWMLGSRMSYLLSAPEATGTMNAMGTNAELQSVAQLLEIDLPPIASTTGMDEATKLRQLLAAGRDLGKSVAARHGDDHAALIEIAFKSNMLIAVIENRPQLKHTINSSVAAAAVRAGLPESLWQPWQTQVAESDSAAAVAAAVVDLHTQITDFLEHIASSDSEPASSVRR